MKAKCNFCDFFGKEPHCHNCKILNTLNSEPKEITCSIEELIDSINNSSDVLSLYNIGDYKYIELLNGERVKMVLLDSEKDILADNSGKSRSTFGIFDMDGSFKMNEEATNKGGWEESKMRTVRMERFFRLLPNSIKSAIKPVIKYTSSGLNSEKIISSVDKCFLFSEIEIKGTSKFSYHGEGSQYEFFIHKQNQDFYRGSFWLRSPYRDGSRCFCYIYGDGSCVYNSANCTIGVAFGFCI